MEEAVDVLIPDQLEGDLEHRLQDKEKVREVKVRNGNGQGEEKRVLMCPFLREYCLEGRCAIYEKLMRVAGGMKQEAGMCGLVAGNAILSEVNTALHQQSETGKVVVPGLYRG